MREIKFRAWDKKNNKMVEPSGVYGNQKYWQLESGSFQYWGIFDGSKRSNNRICGNADDSGILMQYTGLKDNNGVEIYEGDIVCSKGNFFNSEVMFDCGTFYFDQLSAVETYQYEWEVIGNIYENPELLETK